MPMNAELWEASSNTAAMLSSVAEQVSPRKLRLFLVAIVREARRFHKIPAILEALDLAERFADGLIERHRLVAIYERYQKAWHDTEIPLMLSPDLSRSVELATRACRLLGGWNAGNRTGSDREEYENKLRYRNTMLREILGNPFLETHYDPKWTTPTIHNLARGAYDAKDYTTLPVLADALEELGCNQPRLLAHLRSEATHVRGCWALDLVLGKK